MSLYLVRHAASGDRYRWSGDDLERPLDDRGRHQAEAIAHYLSDRPITRVLSSRAVRCLQTVGPLGHRLGLDIEVASALIEGSSGEEAAALARSLVDVDAVLCSHGDVLPAVVRTLALDGTHIGGVRGCAKGSIWELAVEGSAIVTARYLGQPPRLAA